MQDPLLSPTEAANVGESVLELADFKSRFLADMADNLALFAGVLLGSLVAHLLSLEPSVRLRLACIAALVTALLALNLRLTHRHGQTLGKRLMGIRLVRTDRCRVSVLRVVLLRWPSKAFLMIVGLRDLDAIFALGRLRRSLHDRISGTLVVRAR